MNIATPIDRATVLQTLRQVIDPELGMNIVDLGLIYGVVVNGPKVTVNMTVTTPGCPMQDSLKWGVHAALVNLKDVDEVDVQLVFDPPWTPDHIAPRIRAEMGIV
jgi:metal-sulfur cluster biosynthetic enzyme